jgi:hypothetical protein
MIQTCYLCGKEIAESGIHSRDHVVPQQLISRKQPKAKGFAYAGTIPTHKKCNNEFGPETYCAKALKLIGALHDPNCASKHQLVKNSLITVMAINSDCLKEFTKKDLRFFKFIDARNNSIADLSESNFYSGKPRTNPKRDALFTTLAVLTKSAAALLVSRHLHRTPPRWKVLAIPYTGVIETTVLDDLLGHVQPFDIGVKVWLRQCDTGDWFVCYRANNLLLFLLYKLSETDTFWNGMIERFPNADHLCFEGEHLNALIDYRWKKV